MSKSPVSSLAIHVGSRLSRRRTELGISQRKLASRLDIASCHLCDVENGKWRCNIEYLWTLSKELQVDMNYFFEGLK